jgi:hypothetical protein
MLFSVMVDVALERGIERYTGVIPDPYFVELAREVLVEMREQRAQMMGSQSDNA